MPRGPRFAFENSFLHVFNRGINKEPLFLDSSDYDFFLKKLLELKKKYDHSLYALCLLPNHFHLSFQTRKIPISKIMASLCTSYSLYFNKAHNHFGPVFQNRFKSILIENDSYFLELSKYIYLNPVKAGLVSNPLAYPYSSFGEAIGEKTLTFLDPNIIRLVGKTKESQESYKNFVYQGFKEDFAEFERLFNQEEAVFGSNQFKVRAIKKYFRKNVSF